MTPERLALLILVLLLSVAYYGLSTLALRDVWRRPAVRGDNKVLWVLVILCLPILGALLYGFMGAASFLPRRPATVSNLTDRARTIAGRQVIRSDSARPSDRKPTR
jgi:hypothetical protein